MVEICHKKGSCEISPILSVQTVNKFCSKKLYEYALDLKSLFLSYLIYGIMQ